ncbi:hypothetical protein JTB14_013423 [Gonioctena quinquepunctata]|nr:hypothetical protein JTB14_013423 [Gonioctena quinquepunctata]
MENFQPIDKSLKPLKAIIHGPPASGKTKLAERLCQRYGAHYVSVKTMIDEILQELQQNINRVKEKKDRIRERKAEKEKKDDMEEETEDEEEEELEEEDEVDADVEDWEEQIKDITMLMAKSENNRLPDEVVVRLMKTFLAREICQTRGYVLDGFPKTTEQAREIFGQAAETGEHEEGAKMGLMLPEEGEAGETDRVGALVGNASDIIMPDFVVSLEATDDFLCERVMKLPQKLIQGTHYDEKNMLRRLAEFREKNTEDNTVLNFFDGVGIHPILINSIDEVSGEERDLDCLFEAVCTIFGAPIPGFGLSPEDEEAIRKLEREQRRLLEEEDQIQRELLEKKATSEHQEKMEKWADTFELLQKEEEKILVAQSEPQRTYLMKYVFPTLSKGLIEVAKMKPEDPVDFLAEFLFRENPEGKMFDPSYTHSNHFGIAAIYSVQAIERGLLGMSFTNTSPLMVPTGAKKAALGSNPLSLGAPGLNGDSFVLDMATTAVAVGQIELQVRKGEPIPKGWALNEEGQVETDAGIAYKARKLMPLGGQEVHSTYKGFGLGMLVEIFCGMLAGSSYGPNVRSWNASSEIANLGQAFMAINPKVFAPCFEKRMSDLMDTIRNMEPVDPNKPVLVAGDHERIHMKKVDKEGGLKYVRNQHETNSKLAKKLNVKPMVSK